MPAEGGYRTQSIPGTQGRGSFSAAQAIIDRGLAWPGVENNARLGMLFEATTNIPGIAHTSLGGTAPEILFGFDSLPLLKPLGPAIPIAP